MIKTWITVAGQAKKRSKKTGITDIAVRKVVLTKLAGFTPEENQLIQNVHRKILETAMKENDSNEVGALVNLHTWDVELLIGTVQSVDLKADPKLFQKIVCSRKNTYMFAHNHPSTATFSAEDFKVFCKYSSFYLMSVVGNDGSVYIMKKEADFKPDDALEYYYRRARYYKRQGECYTATCAMQDLLRNAADFGIYYRKER